MALVRAVTSMREERGLTNQQLIDGAEMSASYYYARLRGDAPFDTNDIEDSPPHSAPTLTRSPG